MKSLFPFHATLRTLSLLVIISIPSHSDTPAPAAADSMPGMTLQKDFPESKLRGYGTLSAKSWTDTAGGSILRIECQDAEHARLLQAKYLSDLGELPPATTASQVDVGGTKVSIQTADNVGSVAALRHETTVLIATAPSADALTHLLTTDLPGDHSQWTSDAEGKVPMYLNRFDKYGFRFYYAPGNLKRGPDGKEIATYDPREDFDYAKATNGGLLVWTGGQQGETAEGQTRRPSWNWALDEAKEKGLSFGINLGIEGSTYWYYNRHPESLMQFAPGFLGTYYGSMNFGIGPMVAWSSSAGQDAMLEQLQGTVRDLTATDNITSWLEPHEELGGGIADLLVDFGPGADANFQDYLRDKYQTVSAVSQRWYGDTTTVASWKDIKVPEPADFLGWSADALDLAGKWKVSYEEATDSAALAPGFDDSAWGEIVGPGHGLARMLPRKPALWRRHLNIDATWLQKHPKVWLYVFDLNDTRPAAKDPSQMVLVSVNGKTIPETRPIYNQDHWAALDVTAALQEGDNLVAIRLPNGIFNYRAYLSGSEPVSYPNLGDGRNAQWVDFIGWSCNLRKAGVRRGMQMIRQADPNRGIVLMAPDAYEDYILEDAIEFGGDFHNTGYMGGWWCDKLPSLMRGAGLPFSVEPSQGPTLPVHLMGSFGNWITQGCNAIDHFQNLGEILWNPDLKQFFADHAPMYTSIGRYHVAPAEIAALYSNHINKLFGFPWVGHLSNDEAGEPYFRGGSYPSGFNCRGFFSPMEYIPKTDQIYESDAVTELSFVHDRVGKYRVVVDSDTAVLDEDTINGIERYVRAGGIFVTYGETGRHSPEKPDSWPIERLTGFHVASPKPFNGTVSLAADQTVLPADFGLTGKMTGLCLNAVAPEVQTLMNWNDGSVAIGLRPLGKGYIVTLGPFFSGQAGVDFFAQLLKWAKLNPIPAHFEPEGTSVFWRHFLSNNGLYDVWVVRNPKSVPASGALVLADTLRPAWSIDLNSGVRTPVTDGQLPVNLPPSEMAIYITPRSTIANSSAEWLDLQRGWWQGVGDPGAPFAKADRKLTVDLSQGWSFQAVDPAQQDVTAQVDPKTDDSAWKQMPLGIFTLPDNPDVRHFVVRKRFHVPNDWNHGRTLLRLPEFKGQAKIYLDGQLSTPASPDPDLPGGSDHVIAVEDQGPGALLGARGSAWLTYHPDPVSRQDLGGDWKTSDDDLTWGGTVTIPGTLEKGVHGLRTNFHLDTAAVANKTVVVHAMENSRQLTGVVINGQYVRPHVRESAELNLNITPWIRPGQDNELIFIVGGSTETITDISLEFHTPGTYP